MLSALTTDLYELTMMAGYEAGHRRALASFELFVRRLPPTRAFLVAAGLEQAVEYLLALRFTAEDIAFLRTEPALAGASNRFFERTLADLRFTGALFAVPEGTPVFAGEPILRVTAPLIEAQLVETALLSLVTFQTSVASKAARVVSAAGGRAIMEFGSRRAHGPEAGVLAARAACLAGCASTSNVEAGRRFGLPLSGTMAHSWVLSFPDERAAFEAFARVHGSRSVLLLDTYDTLAAARTVVAAGLRPMAVRLDSGDLLALSRGVRQVLDGGGLHETQIVASGDLDEWAIAGLVSRGAPIDGFGVGTALATSIDAPALGGVYKLVEIDEAAVTRPVMKLSGEKSTAPGRKQVWRRVRSGRATGDIIALEGEEGPPGSLPLLEPVLRGGRRVGAAPTMRAMQSAHVTAIGLLPDHLRRLDVETGEPYPVAASRSLDALTGRTEAMHEKRDDRSRPV